MTVSRRQPLIRYIIFIIFTLIPSFASSTYILRGRKMYILKDFFHIGRNCMKTLRFFNVFSRVEGRVVIFKNVSSSISY